MCGIAGVLNLEGKYYESIDHHLNVMNDLQAHRGPDGKGIWSHKNKHIGFAHRRLSIIDLSTGDQPMIDQAGNVIAFNGEIYNYIELKQELTEYSFKTSSDTEVILAAYHRWGFSCVDHFEGMFSFVIWDEKNSTFFAARDRFGIKPFYYLRNANNFYFASEPKALLPFVNEIKTNPNALKDYLTFQLVLDGKTLFQDISELLPAHKMIVKNGNMQIKRYWQVEYEIDLDHTQKFFYEGVRELLHESVKKHLRSDVPVGAYLSGGIDSSIVASLASKYTNYSETLAFTGKFSIGESYDESMYARTLANERGIHLHELDITSNDFINSIADIIYHLDYPVAGPGSFPQYHVSKLASENLKVVLGGQGGDEIFGGYVRYLVAYFEQCIKGAIDDTLNDGNFIVTYESIIPNLKALQNYKPLLKEFWRDGLFEALDKRYFRLINRSLTLKDEINWDALGYYSSYETFRKIFYENDQKRGSYFDSMSNFDFNTLLPGLLHVEDRVSMAHGLESRVPFLNHKLVEFAATIPANIKFKDGTLKRVLINSLREELPDKIVNRKNKMGFPVPLNEWLNNGLRGFAFDMFNSQKAKDRPYFKSEEILKGISTEPQFGRKIWGLLSLELWHQQFIDKQQYYKSLLNEKEELAANVA